MFLTNSDFPLIYCESPDLLSPRAHAFWVTSLVIDVLFLLTFILALFSCKKMYGVELMYIIQLGYYSLIPTNTYCPPFYGLKGLRYSTGFNPLF